MRLGILALGLSDVAPLVVPRAAGSSVMPCLRIIIAHTNHIAEVVGVVAEAVVHDSVGKLCVLGRLGKVVLIQFIHCHISEECGGCRMAK